MSESKQLEIETQDDAGEATLERLPPPEGRFPAIPCQLPPNGTFGREALMCPLLSVRVRHYGVSLARADMAGVAATRSFRRGLPILAMLDALPRELQGVAPREIAEPAAVQRLLRDVLLDALVAWRLSPTEREMPLEIDRSPREVEVRVPGRVMTDTAVDNGVLEPDEPRNARLASDLDWLGIGNDGPHSTARLARDLGFDLTWATNETHIVIRLVRRRDLVRAAELRRRVRTPEEARSEQILDVLRRPEVEAATRRQLQKLTGIARSTLNRDLTRLVDAGQLERLEDSATDRRQRYALVA